MMPGEAARRPLLQFGSAPPPPPSNLKSDAFPPRSPTPPPSLPPAPAPLRPPARPPAQPTAMRDLGSNFYLTEEHAAAGTPRREACLPQLKSLNPYCKVEAHDSPTVDDGFLLQQDVNGTGKPFAAVVVTQLLPKAELLRVNETCRAHGIAFMLAITNGVTASLFSDFGAAHAITDANGEPVEALALSRVELLPAKPACLKVEGVEDGAPVVVLTCDSNWGDKGIEPGQVIELDDMQGAMAPLNGKHFVVKRLEFRVSDPKRAFAYADGSFQMLLKESTAHCAALWQRQLAAAQAAFEGDAANAGKKFKSTIRELTLLNRLVLVGVEAPAVFDQYQFGGLINPVKPTVTKAYASLAASLVATTAQTGAPDVAARCPQMLEAEAGGRGDGIDVHLALSAVLDFQEKEGRWPRLHDGADADAVLELAAAVSERHRALGGDAIWAQTFTPPDWLETFDNTWGVPRELDGARVRRFSRLFGTELTGLCAYLGGAVAQEVIKKTGKFTPVEQWIHHEDAALVTDECASNVGPPIGGRYDDQIAVLGKDFQARAADLNIFVVGCGALGCEYLKGLSLMGVGVGESGKITVTDMDTIETSNLSRQFLFRSTDVGASKSVSGARVVKAWNPEMHIEGVEQFVGPSTEHYFTDGFWENLDLCWNALDNVLARQYTDGKCLWHAKPLLESGTTGTKSNSEVVLPFRTASYNDGEDPPEVAIAMCTLRSFPYLPLHCIEFAKQALYTETFEFGPTQYESFRTDKPGFFATLADMPKDSDRMEAMAFVKGLVDLQAAGGTGIDFGTCIALAFEQLVGTFRSKILEVIANGDATEAKDGKPYWTGTKRRPNPVEWSGGGTGGGDDALATEYLFAAANMYAHVFGLEPVRDRAAFGAAVAAAGLAQPEWEPADAAMGSSVVEEGAEEADVVVDAGAKAALEAALDAVDVAALQEMTPHDFEKDDDDNFHIDYLTIAANVRAWNYNIKPTARHAVKVIAGRIIPALATTTAMVCGLVDIEFCKLVLGLQGSGGVSKFLNSNINLAAGSEAFSVFNPAAPEAHKTGLGEAHSLQTFTTWDKIELREGGRSAAALVALLEKRYGVTVESLSGETNYNPAKSVPLWKAGDVAAGDKTLSALFLQRMEAGEQQADRSAANKKRAKAELKKLQADAPEGVSSVATKEGDDFVFQLRMAGPAGSPYAAGLFLVEVKLPEEYPAVPPSLAILTPIRHCNILDGVPCPNLLFGAWSPSLTVHSVVTQLAQLLKEQSRGDALVPALAAMDEAAFEEVARENAAQFATPDQQFPPPASSAQAKGGSGGSKKDAAPFVWPHAYFILKGEFENAAGEEARLPRIKVKFDHTWEAAGGAAAAAPEAETYVVEDVSAEVRAKIMAMTLEMDGEPLTVKDCAKLLPHRVEMIVDAGLGGEGLTADNAVAVTCVDAYDTLLETVVNADTMAHVVFEDPIMMSEASIGSLVEARFSADGPWVLSRGALENVDQEKGALFSGYEGTVSKEQPDCLSALRRMLQAGPVTKLYTGGGGKFVKSHEGFALRMPPAEVAAWQMTNDKGELQDIPRPAHSLRVWNPAARAYDAVDATLGGAPTTPAEVDAWFVGVVKKLKASPYVGPALLDALVTSEKTTSMERLMEADYAGAFTGAFSNRWTDLVVQTKL